MSYLTAPETESGVSEPAFMMSAGTVTGIERIVLTSPLARVRTMDSVSASESTPDDQNIRDGNTWIGWPDEIAVELHKIRRTVCRNGEIIWRGWVVISKLRMPP